MKSFVCFLINEHLLPLLEMHSAHLYIFNEHILTSSMNHS